MCGGLLKGVVETMIFWDCRPLGCRDVEGSSGQGRKEARYRVKKKASKLTPRVARNGLGQVHLFSRTRRATRLEEVVAVVPGTVVIPVVVAVR